MFKKFSSLPRLQFFKGISKGSFSLLSINEINYCKTFLYDSFIIIVTQVIFDHIIMIKC